ncbi:MAG: uncharacterized protein QOI20_1955 [Acidimicrobiaceae bacterium]|jgi:uncharacterized membrane protein YqgA involved in biofilm formation|nr:uncharacterized protein [Acidimicrobiaceae bacterium]
MRGLGTIVNVATVLIGTAIGLVAGRRVPERLRATVLDALGLITIALGLSDALRTRNFVFPVVALVVGTAVGEAIGIEERLASVGERLRRRATDEDEPGGERGGERGGGHGSFVEGFVSASLVFCVGPLTVLGSISDGLGHGAQELIVKAAMDGLVAVVFASTLGIGVGFSALTVLVVQGGLTAGAGAADRVLTERMVAEMTAAGGIMLMGIGVRLLDVKPVRVASMLPALVIAPLLVSLFAR